MCSCLVAVVDRVVNWLPQLQVTCTSAYFGWIFSFMASSLSVDPLARGSFGYRVLADALSRGKTVNYPAVGRSWQIWGRNGAEPGGGERAPLYPRRIESKNSLLFLVALILSSRNSIASSSSIG